MRILLLASMLLSILWSGTPAMHSASPALAPQMPLLLSASRSVQNQQGELQNSAQLTVTTTPSFTNYLPVLFGPYTLIYGYVYSGGVPLADYPVSFVSLSLLDVHPWPFEMARTTTNAEGRYEVRTKLKEVRPPFPPVLYRAQINPEERGGQVSIVATQWFSYSGALSLTLEPMDAGVVLRLDDPSSRQTIHPPYTFRWTSTVRNVQNYQIVVGDFPSFVVETGNATSAVFPVPPEGTWGLFYTTSPIYIAAWTTTGYVRSKTVMVDIKLP